jgi:hypothetical protein
MHQPWLYFCYWFDALVENSGTLSIPYISCHLVFNDDFADDLWISSDITFLTIPCVSHNSIFAIGLMSRSSINWRCQFHTSAVIQFSVTISMSTETQFSWTIYGSAVT